MVAYGVWFFNWACRLTGDRGGARNLAVAASARRVSRQDLEVVGADARLDHWRNSGARADRRRAPVLRPMGPLLNEEL